MPAGVGNRGFRTTGKGAAPPAAASMGPGRRPAAPRYTGGALESLPETFSIGAETREWVVSARDVPALERESIAFVGVSEARDDYSFVRNNPSASQVLATCSGWGWVYVDREWRRMEAGSAYITPRHQLHAYHTEPGVPWRCCWVYVEDDPARPPKIAIDRPKVLPVQHRSLEHAILGLHAEAAGQSDGAMQERWVQLVEAQTWRVVRFESEPDRLWQLWSTVRSNPSFDWNARALCEHAGMSREQLRTLCHRAHGRSPSQHVTYLRMQHAADLLQRTDHALRSIAAAVGYANQFAFSRAFKQTMGASPEAFRRNR